MVGGVNLNLAGCGVGGRIQQIVIEGIVDPGSPKVANEIKSSVPTCTPNACANGITASY